MVVLGLPAGMLGAVLPMLMRVVAGAGLSLGERVGRLLTWNTLGGVAGVLITGFVLMPQAGLRGAFGILALILCAVAGWAVWRSESRLAMALPGGVAALLLALLAGSGEGWRHVLSSGAFRARESEPDFSVMERRKQHVQILFYEDAPDATVTIERGDGIGSPAETGLRVNGKPDASSQADLSSQLLMGHLPLLARSESKDVFILGLGSGITGGAVLCHGVERVVIAENCEPVVRAAKWFEQWNGGVLTDPRASIRVEDARTMLKLSPQLYDVIITQPSNPWTVGVGSVFSQEYYELAASRLKEGGLVAQWFHAYEMHDGILLLVLRTFSSVFPYVEVWDSEAGDIIMLGSKRPWPATPEALRKGFTREPVRRDLARIGITSPETLLARQLASQRTAFAIAGDGAIQRDWFPILEYEAPKAFHMGITSDVLSQFDERGTQWLLATAEKTAALRGLEEAELRAVFAKFTSVNSKLRSYLRWRLDAPAGDARPEPNELRAMACVFRPTGPAPMTQPIPNSANPEARSVISVLEQLKRGNAGERQQGLRDFEGLLRERHPAASWSVAACAAEAARTGMAHGDWAAAWPILNLALKHEPDDRQLQYLARIFAKDQPGAPALTMYP
jgi:spermidine synthase